MFKVLEMAGTAPSQDMAADAWRQTHYSSPCWPLEPEQILRITRDDPDMGRPLKSVMSVDSSGDTICDTNWRGDSWETLQKRCVTGMGVEMETSYGRMSDKKTDCQNTALCCLYRDEQISWEGCRADYMMSLAKSNPVTQLLQMGASARGKLLQLQ